MSKNASHRGRVPAKVVGAIAISVGMGMAAAVAPAHADVSNDQFLSALDNAGVGYGNSDTAVSMAQSICPLLAEPGGNFAGVASQMGGTGGLSPGMASLFTSIAISMYCPNMMASIADGSWFGQLAQSRVPGTPMGIPGAPAGIPGIPMGIPGF